MNGGAYRYEIFLEFNDIEHRQTKIGNPRTNGFVERFNRTGLMSSSVQHLERSSMRLSMRSKWIWISGCITTTMNARIVVIATKAAGLLRQSK